LGAVALDIAPPETEVAQRSVVEGLEAPPNPARLNQRADRSAEDAATRS
jgi:hypothetical protein